VQIAIGVLEDGVEGVGVIGVPVGVHQASSSALAGFFQLVEEYFPAFFSGVVDVGGWLDWLSGLTA
jgi:hypothetical protein